MRRLLILACLLLLPFAADAQKVLPTNTALILAVGPFVDATDGVTPLTAMTVTDITCELYIESDGGTAPTRTAITLAASGSNNDMAHIADDVAGYYSVELTAAQLNFVGRATLAFTDPDVCLPVFVELHVLPAQVYASLYGGTDALQVDVTQVEGGDATDALATGATSALNTYDPPTNAEMEARTLAAGSYFDPATDTVLLAPDQQVDVTKISGALVDPTLGQIGANIVSVTGTPVTDVDDFKADLSGLATAQQVSDVVTPDVVAGLLDELLAGHVVAGSVGAALTVAAALDPPTSAEIKAAMEADGSKLDHLWEMTEDDGGTRRYTANALERAPLGEGSDPTAVATAVLDTLLAGHDTEGSVGEALTAAAAGGDTEAITAALLNAILADYDTAGSVGKALADAAAGLGGTGIHVQPYRVLNGATRLPEAGVRCEFYADAGCSVLVGTDVTDAAGYAHLKHDLDSGADIWILRYKAGVNYADDPDHEVIP